MNLSKLFAVGLLAVSINSFAEMQEPPYEDFPEVYSEKCVDVLYANDPLIVLALATGKKINPNVRDVDFKNICSCYYNQLMARSNNVEWLFWYADQQFAFFQTKNFRAVHSGDRMSVFADTQKCHPQVLPFSR